MITSKMNPLLLPLFLILAVAAVGDADSWYLNKAEYRTLTSQWATVLAKKGIAESDWGRVTLAATRAVLDGINKRRPSSTKAALVEMANVSEAKCEKSQIKAMVAYMENYWELPSPIQGYIDHYIMAQFESCAAKFKSSIKEGKRALDKQDPDWLPSLEKCWRDTEDASSDSLGSILADYLIENFNMQDDDESWEIENQLDRMVEFCKDIMKTLEPAAQVMVQFQVSTYEDYTSKRGRQEDLSWLKPIGPYRICLKVVKNYRDVLGQITSEMSHRRDEAEEERGNEPRRFRKVRLSI